MATVQANLTNLVNARKNIIKAINDKKVPVAETTKLNALPAEISKIKNTVEYIGTLRFYINDHTGKPWSIQQNNDYIFANSNNIDTGLLVGSNKSGIFIINLSGIYFETSREMSVSVKKKGANNFVKIIDRGTSDWSFHTSISYPVNVGDVFKAIIGGGDGHVRGEILFNLLV